MEQKVVETIEKAIGYDFRSKALLEQAFTRKSFANEEGGPDNELLEFVGDEALDLTITRMLLRFFSTRGSNGEFLALVNEGGFTKIKQQYVDCQALSGYMDKLGLAQYLRMGKSDIAGHVEQKMSVKEDLYEAIIGAIAIDSDFDPLALAHSVQIMDGNNGDPNLEPMPIRTESLDLLNKARNEYLDAKNHGADSAVLEAFEAKMNYFARRVDDEIEEDYYELQGKIDDAGEDESSSIVLEQKEVDYISLLQANTQEINHSLPSYSVKAQKSLNGQKDIFFCTCTIDVGEGEKTFESVAENMKLAKEEAAQKASVYAAPFVERANIKSPLKLFAKPEAVAEESEKKPGMYEIDPVSLLNQFSQRGYFDQPNYDFAQSEDRKTWICSASIPALSLEGKGEGRTKPEAKSIAATQLLSAVAEKLTKK
jgi:dsRNA-specific ribonuclease